MYILYKYLHLNDCKSPKASLPEAFCLKPWPFACHWQTKSLSLGQSHWLTDFLSVSAKKSWVADRLFVCQSMNFAFFHFFCFFLEPLTDKKSVSNRNVQTVFFGPWQFFCLSVHAKMCHWQTKSLSMKPKVCHWQTKSLSAIAKWCHWQTKSQSVIKFPNYIIQKRLPTRDKYKQSLAGILLELSVRCS